MSRYVFKSRVVKADHRTGVVQVSIDPATGQEVSEVAPLGWFVVVDSFPHQPFFLGLDKPDPMPVVGQLAEVTVELKGG